MRRQEEYNLHILGQTYAEIMKRGQPVVVDFGAGHSVYRDPELFKTVKRNFELFQNVALLLPYIDVNRSLEIINKRSIGDTRENLFFLPVRVTENWLK